jgi:salicylate synthase
MSSPLLTRYFEEDVALLGDPLDAVCRLASSGLHKDYVVYENDGQWSYAGGAFAEISLDRHGAQMKGPVQAMVRWDDTPLASVRRLLACVPIEGWRAYGWAAFELAYAKGGDIGHAGSERLLHLVVPYTEVRLADGRARVRSCDPRTLAAAVGSLPGQIAILHDRETPLDVRGDGGEEYQRAVELALGEIQGQRFQKVILSRVVPVRQEIDFVATYANGRRGNSPARSFLLNLGGIESAGFCPEIVVQVDADGRVVSQPLAGTRALTRLPSQNARLRAELLQDSKEVYEHAISVKTACEDLSAVCQPDSLVVEEFMAVRERGSVQHLASRVAGKLAAGRDAWDAFAAAFPAVTASGVPRDAAFACIRASEAHRRGLYSGAVLTVDQDGSMDAGLVLRAVYREHGLTWLQAGAGIVGQSRPAREYEETCEKLDSVARFLVATTGTELLSPSEGGRRHDESVPSLQP